VRVDYDSVGSGEGVRRFVAEEVDFGASDSGMSRREIAAVSRGVRLVPTTAGCIALAYNLAGIDGDLKLSRDVYVDLFMGRIANWNDPRIRALNPDLKLPKAPISVVARLDSSGTTSAFTSHLSAISPAWKDSPGAGKVIDWPGPTMLANGNEGVAAVVQRTAGAIGYVEFGIASRAGLKMAWLENKAGKYVAPTGASGMATLDNNELGGDLRLPDPSGDDSYAIVTYTWLMLYERYHDPKTGDAVQDFVRWCLTDGQPYNEQLGYVRLPPAVAARALATLDGNP
jgi:phosphate transport system substrate-binding protein